MSTSTAEATKIVQAAYKYAKEKAKAGDWADYVRVQWPNLILDDFQQTYMDGLFDKSIAEIYMKGNTGCGKGAVAAVGCCAYFDVFEDCRIIITSKSITHAEVVMFSEIKKWMKRARMPIVRPDTMFKQQIIVDEQHKMYLTNPESEEAFSGQHSNNTCVIVDEATGVADSRISMAETQANKLICLANPRTTSGAFRNAFPIDNPDETKVIVGRRGPRLCITIDGAECMNVREKRLAKPVGPIGGIEIDGKSYRHGETIPTEEWNKVRPIIPGQTSYDKFQEQLNHPSPWWVRVMAHAKFPEEDLDKQLFPRSELERHIQYWQDCHANEDKVSIDNSLPVTCFSMDVAGSQDGDETVVAAGGIAGCRKMFGIQSSDTMYLSRWALELVKSQYGIDLLIGDNPIAIDMDGIGNGVGNRLMEQGVWVLEIRSARSAETEKTRFGNRRAELYGLCAERMASEGPWADKAWAIPPDSLLIEELVAHEKVFKTSDIEKFFVTPKRNYRKTSGIETSDTIKDRLGRSPDRSDALVYLYAAVKEMEEVGLVSSQFDATDDFEVDDSWLPSEGEIEDFLA